MNDLRIVIEEELSKSDVKNIINVINQFVENPVIKITKDKPMASHYVLEDGSHAYMFNFDRAITSTEADSIIGGLYSSIDYNFVAEIESDIIDEEDDEEDDFSEESEVVQHSRWMQEQINEGWVYGMEFSENSKKNPYLRPYHMLTKNQKNVLRKSKEKTGKYGLYSPYVMNPEWVGDHGEGGDAGE